MELKEKVTAFVKSAYEDHAKDGVTLSDEDISHLNEVMETAAGLSDDVDIICAAGLHDILERTTVTAEDIEKEFNDEIARIVSEINKCCRCDITGHENWLKEMTEMALRVQELPEYEKAVILADYLSNAKKLVSEYAEAGEEIYEIYGTAKDEFISFYKSMTRALNELDGTDAWEELDKITSSKPFAFEEFPYDTKILTKLNYEVRTADVESVDQFSTRLKDQIILLLVNLGLSEDAVVPVVSRYDAEEVDDENPDESLLFNEETMTYYAMITRPFEGVKTVNMKITDLFKAACKSGVYSIVINPDDEYYVLLIDWIRSVVFMKSMFEYGEHGPNEDTAVISRDEDNVEYTVSINRPTDEHGMSTITHFIREIENREGDTVLIKFKESKPKDGIKKIRISYLEDAYKMELFYDMTEFDWDKDLDLGSEGLPFVMVEDLIRKLCVLGIADKKIPFIMHHFKNITED